MGLTASLQAVPEKMVESTRNMQLGVRELQLATAIAQSRDMLLFTGGFTATVAMLATAAFLRTKSKAGFVPLLPLSFVTGYQYDFAYGNKLERVRAEAESILANERKLLRGRLAPPEGNVLISTRDYSKLFNLHQQNEQQDRLE
jgi:hypothetical protein